MIQNTTNTDRDVAISVIGSGYVGLVTGACFADKQFKTTCMDIDKNRIEKLRNSIVPFYEENLEDMLERNKHNLTFTTDALEAFNNSQVIMICVGTPTGDDGRTNMKYIFSAAETIAKNLNTNSYKIIVVKSTIPPGTCMSLLSFINQINPEVKEGVHFDMVFNPEFLREGTAINDFLYPDRVVIGLRQNSNAKATMTKLYEPFTKNILFTDLASAEMSKHASNAFLALKISFANQISDLCEKLDADAIDVLKIVGQDNRIGPMFLNPGPGYGGSCFPKDTLELYETAKDKGMNLSILNSVIEYNEERKTSLANRIIGIFENKKIEKKLSVLGLAFKGNTDDLRESPAMHIVEELLKARFKVKIYDPQYKKEYIPKALNGIFGSNIKKLIEFGLEFTDSVKETCSDVAGVAILTEWNEFRSLDLVDIKKNCFLNVERPLLIDFRNLLCKHDTSQWEYYRLGANSKNN